VSPYTGNLFGIGKRLDLWQTYPDLDKDFKQFITGGASGMYAIFDLDTHGIPFFNDL